MICPIVTKSKETCQQAITSNVISKYFSSLNKSKTYHKKKEQLPTLKKKKMIQTKIAHNSHVLFIRLRPVNTDVTTFSTQEVQPWIPWLLKKELIQVCMKTTESTYSFKKKRKKVEGNNPDDLKSDKVSTWIMTEKSVRMCVTSTYT